MVHFCNRLTPASPKLLPEYARLSLRHGAGSHALPSISDDIEFVRSSSRIQAWHPSGGLGSFCIIGYGLSRIGGVSDIL